MKENSERVWKLYKYTCIHNGLIYFGITSKTLDERWRDKYIGNPRLHNCIMKYGKEGFIREIILDGLTLDEAAAAEIEHIAKYNATDKNIGFNISIGGTAPMAGRHHSEERNFLKRDVEKIIVSMARNIQKKLKNILAKYSKAKNIQKNGSKDSLSGQRNGIKHMKIL